MDLQGNGIPEDYVIVLEAYNETRGHYQDLLFYMPGTESQSEGGPRTTIFIVPAPKKEIKFEGTLRERCKMRKKTSRRRREFEAAKARKESS